MKTVDVIDWRPIFDRPKVEETGTNKNETKRDTEKQAETDKKVNKTGDFKRDTTKSLLRVFSMATLTGAVVFVSPTVSEYVTLMVTNETLVDSGVVGVISHYSGIQEAIPVTAQGNVQGGWDAVITKVIWIVDYLMSGVIIFSGISWMFGNKTKAIELLLGSGIGYVIVRHHEDIKNFFSLL